MSRRTEKLHERLAQGRARAVEIMADTCRITRPGGEPVLNEANGEYETPPPITVYEGPCRIQVRADVNSNVVEVTAGEKEWAYQTATLAVPVVTPTVDELTEAQRALYPDGPVGDTANVRVDHTASILTSAEDPGLVGRVFQIRAIHHKTHATSRRFRITEAM